MILKVFLRRSCQLLGHWRGDACFICRATTPPSLSPSKIKESASQAKEGEDQENAARVRPGVRNEIIENFQRNAFGGMQEETGGVPAMMAGTLNEESMRQSFEEKKTT